MSITNSRLHKAIQDIDPSQSELLATFVKRAAKSRDSIIKDRAELFFQAEPFAREFDEYRLLEPIGRKNFEGYSMSSHLSSIGVAQKGKQHRATLFAWLSYYHPEEAEAYCAKTGAEIPAYRGHPDLNGCSPKAIEYFVRQERVLRVDPAQAESPKTPLPASPEVNAQSDYDVKDDKTTLLAVANGAGGSGESETLIESEEPEPSKQDGQEPVTPDGQGQGDEGNKRKLVVASSLVALLLLGTALIAAVNSGIFRPSSEEDETASEESPTNLAANDDPVVPEEPSEDQSGDNIEETEPTEADAENEPAASASKPSREINPVWNNITGFAWSTKELNYYYPTLRSANLSDLQEAARQGNTAAQTLLGVAHISGWLGQRDYDLAIREYLRPACANGQGLAQGRACALLGVHYGAGLGVPKNITTAAEFYSKACRLGNLTGCYYEGVRYLHGEGTARDLPRAITIFKDTCELGVGYSCLSLSDIYGQGNGVEKDLELATWYQLRYQRLRTPI